MANFDQFLDSLTDEELQLMDSDPDFFKEMKTQYDSQNKKTGLDKAVEISEGVNKGIETLMSPITKPVGKLVQGSEELSNKLAESGHPILGMAAAAPEIAVKSIAKPFEWASAAGEKTTEALGGSRIPILNKPEVAAGIGTGISMIPDIIASGLGGKFAKKGASVVAKGASKAATPFKKAVALVKSPGEAEARAAGEAVLSKFKATPKRADVIEKIGKTNLSKLQEKLLRQEYTLKGLPAEKVEKLATKGKALSETGKTLESLESEAGLSFKELGIPKPPKQVRRFANVMKKYADLTEEQILNRRNIKGNIGKVQNLRKRAQLAKKMSIPTEYKALIGRGQEKLAAIVDSEIGESYSAARQAWKALDDEISNIPSQFIKKKSSIQQALSQTKAEITQQKSHISDLLKQSKKADSKKLLKIESELAESVSQATIRDAKLKKLKALGWATGAAAIGLGGPAAIIGALK